MTIKNMGRIQNCFRINRRNFSVSSKSHHQVTIIGAAGGIGQPLALLLKINPLITKLNLYDVAKVTPGVAVDLSHIETPSKVTGFVGDENLCYAMEDSDLIIVTAGVPRKPGMERSDLFKVNAGVVKNTMKMVAKAAPRALIAIVTNPVNSVVPVAAEILKKAGALNSKKLFGVTTLDTVRANTFVAEKSKMSPFEVKVPVIGGHSGLTIVPILSRISPNMCIPRDEMKALTARIQNAGTEVVNAKGGAGSATLSMAYAGARFTNSLLRGLNGEADVVEPAYVLSDCTEVPYFSTPLKLGKCGIQENLGIGKLDECEKEMVKKAICILKQDIEMGIAFANEDECDQKSEKS